MSVQPLAPCCVSTLQDGPPSGAWQWSQTWRDVLFSHWQVPAINVTRHLPPGLELDLWEGAAWVSAVAFRLCVRRRRLPTIWPVSHLLELNLRTYVRRRGRPGIYFLSMHADNRLAILFARWLTPLPYAAAKITYDNVRFAAFAMSSADGTSRRAGMPAMLFDAQLETHGECHAATPDSLDAWLLERYLAFVPDRQGRMLRMTVEHAPWQVYDTTLSATAPRLGEPWGLELARPPGVWHYSSGVEARVQPFEIA